VYITLLFLSVHASKWHFDNGNTILTMPKHLASHAN